MTEDEILARLYSGLDREGPGNPEDVQWAIDRLGLGGALRVCDAGCGSGADSVSLAQALPQARIDAIEQLPHLAEEARARCAGLANVSVSQGSMARLKGPYDLIWCAGALYFLGVTEGLNGWRTALAPNGAVAFSEPVQLGANETAETFWQQYPAITDLDGIVARIDAAGFETIDHRLIVGAPWEAFFGPLETHLGQLNDDGDPDFAAAIAASREEIRLWRSAPDQIAYALMLVRPR